MEQSTIIIAFDQHAESTVAAVLLPGSREPMLHTLTDVPAILKFVLQVGSQDTVVCCYEAGPCGFDLQRALTGRGVPLRRHRPVADSPATR